MLKIKDVRDIVGCMFERRKRNEPVSVDRRKLTRLQSADKRLHEALRKLNESVRPKSDDNRKVANDSQQEVQFATFRDICTFRLEAGQHRLCRHKNHEAANTGVAKCDEAVCPFMLGTAKSAA